MICCVECFKDSELRAIIESLKVNGDCDICNHKDVFIYDIDKNNRLTEIFEGLIEIYTPVSEMSKNLKKNRADFSLLRDALHENWTIFNIDKSKTYKLIAEICKDKLEEKPKLFEEAVGISRMYDIDFKENFSILKNSTWSEFTKEIKHGNRYHLDSFNKEVFAEIIDYASTTYEKGHVFHRARISTNENKPFTKKLMGPPPRELSSGGRLNPKGISCLYLASNEDVAIKEIRTRMHDHVTLAQFELLENIEVIDLTMIDKFSPFLGIDSGFDYENYAINNKHLTNIAKEFLIPSKEDDPYLTYLPSQYISEFIKSLGKQGIKYQSTMDNNGYNIVVFDDNLLECKDKDISSQEITDITYSRR